MPVARIAARIRFTLRRLFAPGAIDESAYRNEYLAEQASSTIRQGRAGTALAVLCIPLFAIQDVVVLKSWFLPWRLAGLVPAAIFLAASFSPLRLRRSRVAELYVVPLLGLMVMMCGIVLSVYSDPASTDYRAYLVLDSLVVIMLAVYLFSAGARKYLAAIFLVPYAALLAALITTGVLPPGRIASFSNPAAAALALIVMGALQERLSYREFAMRKVAAARALDKERAEQRTREDRQILQSFLDSVAERAFVVDKDGIVVFANLAFAAGAGVELREAVGKRLDSLVPADAARRFAEVRGLVASGKAPVSVETEHEGFTFENMVYPVLDSGNAVAYVGILSKDITARKAAERKLEFIAGHDALTGLLNRRSFLDGLEEAVARSRSGRAGALMYADLDGFKAVNDTMGHEAGDEVLKAVAGIISASIRGADAAYRMGGDEFAVVMGETALDVAFAIAERLRAAVKARRFAFGAEAMGVSMSVGVVPIDGSRDAETVLAQADAAMYRAKRSGKDRVEG